MRLEYTAARRSISARSISPIISGDAGFSLLSANNFAPPLAVSCRMRSRRPAEYPIRFVAATFACNPSMGR